MRNENEKDPDLAAALFAQLGAQVPHDVSREGEAEELIQRDGELEKSLLRIAKLCKEPSSPRELYLTALAYSWLGKNYCAKAARYAEEYLHTPGWEELPSEIREEDGIVVNYAASQRAAVIVNLANALEGLGYGEKALLQFMEAYRLEPYNAMNAVRAADLLHRLRGKKEAFDYLCRQKLNPYYEPAVYTDRFGETRRNDRFQSLLDAAILKINGDIKERRLF